MLKLADTTNPLARDPRVATAVESCLTATESHVRTALQALFDDLDDVLFDLADKADSDSSQRAYFDAMRDLRVGRDVFIASCVENISDGFSVLAQRAAPEPTPRPVIKPVSGELSLVDNDRLEEDLAATNMAARACQVYAQHLHELEQRLADISMTPHLAADQQPLAPARLCGALREAAQTLEVDIRTRLLLYKLYERHVLGRIGPLYEQTNTLLRDAGVLPDLKLTTPKPRSTTSRPRDPAQAQTSAHVTAESLAVLKTLHPLLAARRPGVSATTPEDAYADAGTGAGFTPVPATLDDVLAALSQLGARTSGDAISVEPDTLRRQLSERLNAMGPETQIRAMNPIDEDVIDVVCMIFEYILDDADLPDAVKALIGRLQIPMLKVAILDKTFFSSKHHPARCLLNELAKAGIGLPGNVDTASDTTFQQIAATVGRVVNDFEDDVAVFEDMLAEFRNAVDSEDSQQAQQLIASAQAACAEREAVELAGRWVDEIITVRLGDKKLPPVVERIIRTPWREVLIRAYREDGLDSRRWRDRLLAIDALLWSVEPKSTPAERQKLAQVVPQVILTLRRGFADIELPDAQSAALFDSLERYHHMSLKGQDWTALAEAEARDHAARDAAESPAPAGAAEPDRGSMPAAMEMSAADCAAETSSPAEQPTGEPSSSQQAPSSAEPTATDSACPEQDLEGFGPTIQGMVVEFLDHMPDEDGAAEEGTADDGAADDAAAAVDVAHHSAAGEQPAATAALPSDTELEALGSLVDEDDAPSEEESMVEDIVLGGDDAEATVADAGVEDAFTKRARQLDAGTWVEFRSDGKRRRAKLIWKSEVLAEYTFADWKYKVVAEKTLQGLAAELRRGTVTVLNDTPLVDRAVDAIVTRLRRGPANRVPDGGPSPAA